MSAAVIEETVVETATTMDEAPEAAPAATDAPRSYTETEHDRLAKLLQMLERRREKAAQAVELAEKAWEPFAHSENNGASSLAARVMQQLSDARNALEGIESEIPRVRRRLGELAELLGSTRRCERAAQAQEEARKHARMLSDSLRRLQAARDEEIAIFETAMTNYRQRVAAAAQAVATGTTAPGGRRPAEPVYPQAAADELQAQIERTQREHDDALTALRLANAERLHAELAAEDYRTREQIYALAPSIIRRAVLRAHCGQSSLDAGLVVKIDQSDEVFAGLIDTYRRIVSEIEVGV